MFKSNLFLFINSMPDNNKLKRISCTPGKKRTYLRIFPLNRLLN